MRSFDPKHSSDLKYLYEYLDSLVTLNLKDSEIIEKLCQLYNSKYIFKVVKVAEEYIYS